MRPPRIPTLAGLPAECPEVDCGTYLQRATDPSAGVAPHYTTCHPEVTPPHVLPLPGRAVWKGRE